MTDWKLDVRYLQIKYRRKPNIMIKLRQKYKIQKIKISKAPELEGPLRFFI